MLRMLSLPPVGKTSFCIPREGRKTGCGKGKVLIHQAHKPHPPPPSPANKFVWRRKKTGHRISNYLHSKRVDNVVLSRPDGGCLNILKLMMDSTDNKPAEGQSLSGFVLSDVLDREMQRWR